MIFLFNAKFSYQNYNVPSEGHPQIFQIIIEQNETYYTIPGYGTNCKKLNIWFHKHILLWNIRYYELTTNQQIYGNGEPYEYYEDDDI